MERWGRTPAVYAFSMTMLTQNEHKLLTIGVQKQVLGMVFR
jgi:hypothetical protein